MAAPPAKAGAKVGPAVMLPQDSALAQSWSDRGCGREFLSRPASPSARFGQ